MSVGLCTKKCTGKKKKDIRIESSLKLKKSKKHFTLKASFGDIKGAKPAHENTQNF